MNDIKKTVSIDFEKRSRGKNINFPISRSSHQLYVMLDISNAEDFRKILNFITNFTNSVNRRNSLRVSCSTCTKGENVSIHWKLINYIIHIFDTNHVKIALQFLTFSTLNDFYVKQITTKIIIYAVSSSGNGCKMQKKNINVGYLIRKDMTY